jgi:hypothetical protein
MEEDTYVYALFELGTIYATQGFMQTGINPLIYIMRHALGDWGDLCEEDKKENEYSLQHELRLMSAYEENGTKFWIITEADRSCTTILLPEEY